MLLRLWDGVCGIQERAGRLTRPVGILPKLRCKDGFGEPSIMEFAFEREAMQGQPVPKGLDIADSCLYVSLKNSYATYRNKLISRKDAAEEKKRLVYNWETDKSKIEFLNRGSEALRDKIGTASENYKNNPCIETADKLYAAFYNLPDDWRTLDG